MGHAKYIGRVGGLAVALGIGLAIGESTGVAWAEPESSSDSSATSDTGPAGKTAGPSLTGSQSADGADARGDDDDEAASGSAEEGTAEPEAAEADNSDDEDVDDEDVDDEDVDDEDEGTERAERTTVDVPSPSDEPDGEPSTPAAALTVMTAAAGTRREDEHVEATLAAANNHEVSSIPVGQGPAGVAAGPGSLAYVANSADRSVSVVDSVTGAIVDTVNVSGTPSAIAVNATSGRAYVTLRSTGRVAVIDTATNTVLTSVSVGWSPSSVALSPDGKRAYVTNTGSGTLAVIDTATNKRIGLTWLGWSPAGVTVSPDGKRVYAAVKGSDRIAVVNATTNRVVTTVAVGDSPRDVVVTADGSRLYAAYGTRNVAVIDTSSNLVTGPSITVGPTPTALAVSSRNARVYVANSDDSVTVIDTMTNAVLQTLASAPSSNIGNHGIAVSADGNRLYVSDFRDNRLRTVVLNSPPVLTAGPSIASRNPVTGVVSGSFTMTDDSGGPYRHHVSLQPTHGSVDVRSAPAADGATTWTFAYTPTLAAREHVGTAGGADIDRFTVVVRDQAGDGTPVAVSVPIEPLSLTTTTTPITVGESPTESVISGGDLYVLNSLDGTVSVIDRSTRTVTHTIDVGSWVSGLAATPDGTRVYVGKYTEAYEAERQLVAVIDTTSKKVATTIEVPGIFVGEFGASISLIASPDSKRLYVSSQFGEILSVVDTATNRVISSTDVGQLQGKMVLTPDGNRLLRMSTSGAVEVIDVTGTPVPDGQVQLRQNPGAFHSAGLALSADGARAYALTNSNYIYHPAPQPLLFGAISVVDIDPASPDYLTELDIENVGAQDDLAVDSANRRIYLSDGTVLDIDSLLPTYRLPHAGQMTLDPGGTVYVTSGPAGTVYAIDFATPGARSATLMSMPQSASAVSGTSISVGRDPAAVAATGSRVYVANSTGKSLSVIDRVTGSVVATVPLAGTASAVALSPNGSRAYVTLKSTAKLAVIDTGANKVISTVSVGLSPTGVAVNAAGSRVYVTNVGSGSLTVIDAVTNKALTSVWLGSSPTGLTVSPDGSRVYAALRDSDQVAVFDATTNKLVTRVKVGDSPRDVVVSPDGSRAYAVNAAGTVSIVNTATNSIVGSVVPVGPTPTAATISSSGAKVYVANSDDTVSVIDTLTNTVTQTIAVDSAPEAGEHDIAMAANGSELYVTDFRDAVLRVISLNSAPRVTAGPSVGGPSPSDGAVTGSFTVADADRDPLSHFIAVSPTKGSVTMAMVVGLEGNVYTYTYTPTEAARADAAQTPATDTFTVRVTDPRGAAAEVVVTVDVAPAQVNRPPVTGFYYGAHPDGTVTGVLATDPDGDPLTFIRGNGPWDGTFVVDQSGTFTYTPSLEARERATMWPEYNTDWMTYSVSDGVHTVYGEAFLEILDIQTPPMSYVGSTVDGVDHVSGRVTGSANVTDPNGDVVTYTVVRAPTSGGVTVGPEGSFAYTPTPGARAVGGFDTFVIRASDTNAHNDFGVTVPIRPLELAATQTQITAPNGTYAMAVRGTRGYVANYGGTVSAIDLITNTVTRTSAPIGTWSSSGDSEIAVSPDGTRIYVARPLDGNVVVLDAATLAPIGNPVVAENGSDMVVSPDGRRLYLALEGAGGSLRIVDTVTRNVVGSVPIGVETTDLAISPDGRTVYVADGYANSVRVIDTVAGTSTANITLGPPTYLSTPAGIALSPDGRWLYVTDTAYGTLSVIDTTSRTVVGSPIQVGMPRIDTSVYNWGTGVAVSPDGSRVYVAAGNDIVVVDAVTRRVRGAVRVPAWAHSGSLRDWQAIAVDSSGDILVVAGDGVVSVRLSATGTAF